MKLGRLKFYQKKIVVNQQLQFTVVIYCVAFGIAINFVFLLVQLALANYIPWLSLDKIPHIMPFIFFIVFSGAIVSGFYLTNRIAGPIYRLKIHMAQIADGGSIKNIDFRKRDYFSEIIPVYNKLLERLRHLEERLPEK